MLTNTLVPDAYYLHSDFEFLDLQENIAHFIHIIG